MKSKRTSKPHKIKVQKVQWDPKTPKDTMTVAMAWNRARNRMKVQLGNNWHEFSYVGWQSPHDGRKSGPFLVTVDGNIAIEVDADGRFRDAYPATADCYFPWVDIGRPI